MILPKFIFLRSKTEFQLPPACVPVVSLSGATPVYVCLYFQVMLHVVSRSICRLYCKESTRSKGCMFYNKRNLNVLMIIYWIKTILRSKYYGLFKFFKTCSIHLYGQQVYKLCISRLNTILKGTVYTAITTCTPDQFVILLRESKAVIKVECF